jgi:transcription initiation factor TFIIIB Brf1 subunit/transcription initiation factor TFIIB|uniref:General transcription factor TFIIB n=1 Tax=Phaeodactylum tricornutum TaxID=2850 RepID=A0A8J9S4U6_PHATR
MSTTTNTAAAAAAAATVSSATLALKPSETPLWELNADAVEAWMKERGVLWPHVSHADDTSDPHSSNPSIQLAAVATVLWKNLLTAFDALRIVPQELTTADDEEEEDRKFKKRKRQRFLLHDPYHVWIHVLTSEQRHLDPVEWNQDEQDEIPTTLGGKLAQLSLGGLVNGLAGLAQNPPLLDQPTPLASKLAKLDPALMPTASNLSLIDLYRNMALPLYRALQVRVHGDILTTTPLRIQHMLAPDLTRAEFQTVRKRIYETVILGKGMHVNEDDTDPTLATGNSSQVHDVEKFKRCPTCGNNDQANFILDRKNGDVICQVCGTVVSESLMHEGSQFRKFEGEVDRNHHGDMANPLYSNAHNLSTTLGGLTQTTGAGGAGWGANGVAGGGAGKKNLETILRNAHAYTELNVSQFGKTDRRTRVGYKDKQKKDAFLQMTHVGDALNLHEAVVQRAKELFAGFRDDRELVQQFKPVIAACLCEAFEQLSSQGQKILKQQADEISPEVAEERERQQAAMKQSKRATRRNELHHATLAGKGGLLLDFSNVEPTKAAEIPSSVAVEKPAATWDLEDCRSWLLEASRSIAQQWVQEREKATNAAAAKIVPQGSLEELEGGLVEHSIVLCEHLEQELQRRNTVDTGSKRLVTPRVQDMSKLGIRWQHSHERGSGGKGGVGGSGQAAISSGRTAGQVLILKTAKKLGSVLKDPVAGEAIHRELRGVVGRQEAKKLKERREEASRQRLQQMKRKPWLQAKAQAVDS